MWMDGEYHADPKSSFADFLECIHDWFLNEPKNIALYYTPRKLKARWWQLKYFLFSSLFGEDFQFDSYFSDGLKPPTRKITMEIPTISKYASY